MSNKIIWGAGACALVALAVWFAPVSQESEPPITSRDFSSSIFEPSGQNEPEKPKLEVLAEQESLSFNDGSVRDIESGLLSNDVKMQVATAIQSYDEISKYPPGSQPIRSKEHAKAFVNASKPESSCLIRLKA